jgi:hypothetical protein
MEDFGHRPHPNPLLVGYCARCRTTTRDVHLTEYDVPRVTTRTTPVRWPCTSAIVLGLATSSGTTPTTPMETRMDIDDTISDNHRPEDQDPDPADATPAAQVWDGAPDGPLTDTSPF